MGYSYVIGTNIISPLGVTTQENFDAICNHQSGITLHNNAAMSDRAFYASLIANDTYQTDENFTRFEKLLINSISNAVAEAGVDLSDSSTALILSSTKGNIFLLENETATPALKQRISLTASAKKITGYFNMVTKPVIVSNACISGSLALLTAKRLLDAGAYKNVIVSGADMITKFILSGFQSFHAISELPCKPFDAGRNGTTLGEAAATVVLSVSADKYHHEHITLTGGGISNDANHISGPSRTGEELFLAIAQAMHESGMGVADIDFISAHGTATIYNDDMESKAICLAGLEHVPVNSLKGYYGHTLGAAGIMEAVISIESMVNNQLIPTKGFSTAGTEKKINICDSLSTASLSACLKTASGFGGCNAAFILQKLKQDENNQ